MNSVADLVWSQLTLRLETDMESTNSQPESKRRRLPFAFGAIVAALLAGAWLIRMQRAVTTPIVSGGSTQVDAPLGSGISDAASSTQTSSNIEESEVSESLGVKSAGADESGKERTAEIASDDNATDGRGVSGDAASSPGAEFSQRMLGTWEDDYKGHRTLTLNADGTGTMVVELDGLAATLFAEKLTFSEEWTVTDGKVTMKATGGEPEGKVQLVLSLHGDSSTQRIIEVTSERMILIEEPSETRFEWRRVRAAENVVD